MSRAQLLLGGVLAVAAVVGGWWGRPQPVPEFESSATSVAVYSESITVYVSGAVAQPGLVSLRADARVADAVAAAGGVLSSAALDQVNLASPLTDGEQVVIPEAVAPGATPDSTNTGDGRLHLNQATAAELQELPGVGPVLAERIVSFREAHGPFRTIEDLLDVPGIGEAKLAAFKEAGAIP